MVPSLDGEEEGEGWSSRCSIPAGDDLGAAELAGRVATHLRERKRRQMSLDQLAQLTGVSRAALSQIETRKTNPTIGVLWKIASGLGIAFSDLIGESALRAVGVAAGRIAALAIGGWKVRQPTAHARLGDSAD